MSFEEGQIVMSKAGHDKLEYYIVMSVNSNWLMLINGDNRTVDNPKKKNISHVQPTKFVDKTVAEKIKSGTIINEEIKRMIRMYLQK